MAKARARQLVDIDMGIGRQYGYRDPYRVNALAQQQRAASPERVAVELQRMRYDAGVSQRDVARVLGITQTAVSQWERRLRKVPDDVRTRWAELCAEAARRRSRPRNTRTTPAPVEN